MRLSVVTCAGAGISREFSDPGRLTAVSIIRRSTPKFLSSGTVGRPHVGRRLTETEQKGASVC